MSRPLFRLTALSAALAAHGLAAAQEDPAVAELIKPQSEVSFGAGYWNHDRPRLGTYDGMRAKGGYGLLDLFINSRDDATGTWFTLDGRDLGLDTREFRADFLRQGRFGLSFDYNRLVRDEPYTVLTGVQGIGTTTQRVPTPSATAAQIGEVNLGTVREGLGAGLTAVLGGGFDVRFNVRSEDKTGDRLWGRGGAAEFAAEPINSNTRTLEAVLAYTSKAFQVQGGYLGSWYTNRNALVDTALTSGANPYFLSLPLDNQADQMFVNGGYNFSERTRGTFKLSYTRATQNETIPVGTGVPVFAGAPTQLNGRLDNTLMQVGLNSRPTRDFSWVASLRSYESDEKTPQVRVVQTAAACPTCVDTAPITIKTLTGKLEGTLRVPNNFAVVGGVDVSKQDRNVPFGNINPGTTVDAQRYVPWRTEVDETTVRMELRRALAETVNGRVVVGFSTRDGSTYTPTNEPQSELINPLHIADRDRTKVKLVLDWMVAEPLTLTFNVEQARDKYSSTDGRPYGLRDGSASMFSLDAAYAISDKWQLSAWFTRDLTQATQSGQRNARDGAGEAVKDARLEDTGDTFGVGLRGELAPKFKAGLDLLYSKNVNRYPESVNVTGAGTVYPSTGGVDAIGPPPDITNSMQRLKLHGTWVLEKNAELRFDYTHELWKSDDWSWMFAGGAPFTYGTTTDGTQVVQASRQTADWFAVRYIYRFR